MEREFWQSGWDRGRIGFHRSAVNPHLERFWPLLNVAPGAKVLVPLCGKSLDMLWLRDRGYRVVGVEIVRRAVEAFFTENGLAATTRPSGAFVLWAAEGIEIYEGDFFDLGAAEVAGVGAVYDRASLIALPPDLRRDYAARLRAVVPEKTNMLLITLDYPRGQMDGPPFAVSEEEVRALYGDSYEIAKLCSEDGLAANPQLRERGLNRLTETVYLLRARSNAA
jgi:thiopurine S-methyltransferase